MKLSLADDVTPLTDFRTRSAQLLEKIKKTRRPIILTRRGRTAAVVEDIREYENRLDRISLLESIVRGLQAAELGKVVKHTEVMRQMDKLLNE